MLQINKLEQKINGGADEVPDADGVSDLEAAGLESNPSNTGKVTQNR